ncbi:MAG: threonine/serine dehydratase [Candidatus Sulfotelmatobacter sp.]
MITLSDLHSAQSRLHGITVRTRLIEFPQTMWGQPPSAVRPGESPAAACPDRRLFLKPENQQPIGAFKLRGAYNKIASLSEDERKLGVISYSSGNHAQGVAYAARSLGVKAVIVMPNNAPTIKREATAALGAEIVLVGPASDERKAKAEDLAARHGYVIVPPYNDEKIIAGQGTIGLEILEDLPEVETVLSPVGGGGLISGVATAIKLTNPKVKVIGVEPELAADAQASLRSGRIVQFPADQVSRTIADGLRTQSIGPINFEHMRKYVDDIITVSEDEIRHAMKLLAASPATVAEPSGAVAAAGFLFHLDQLPNTKLNVAIISGGNIEPEMLEKLGQP